MEPQGLYRTLRPISCAPMQVYNEAIYDLLADQTTLLGARPALQLKDNAAGRVTVPGLTKVRTHVLRFNSLGGTCPEKRSVSHSSSLRKQW